MDPLLLWKTRAVRNTDRHRYDGVFDGMDGMKEREEKCPINRSLYALIGGAL